VDDALYFMTGLSFMFGLGFGSFSLHMDFADWPWPTKLLAHIIVFAAAVVFLVYSYQNMIFPSLAFVLGILFAQTCLLLRRAFRFFFPRVDDGAMWER